MRYVEGQGVYIPFVKKFKIAIIMAVAAILVLSQATWLLGRTSAENNSKLRICHATSAEQNPYESIEININAIANAHGVHQDTEDIVPPYEDEPDGRNWTPENITLWENDCGEGEVLGENCEAGPSWAFEVKDSDQGTRKDGGAVLAERSNPNNALGAPDSTFFSLGFGGGIEVDLGGYVVNDTGDDLTLHEVTNGPYPEEVVNVEVSQDGTSWVPAGNATNNGGSGGSDGVDISGTGLSWFRYVRVTDTSNTSLFANNADGYDLDAISADIVCQQPEEPEEPCSVTAMSDTTNKVVEYGNANAVELDFIHSAWTADVPDASWIWSDNPVADANGETVRTFTKTFGWSGPVDTAVIKIAADNDYELWVNGTLIGTGTNTFAGANQHDIASAIQDGNNTITVKVTNWAWSTTNPQVNPAGLKFQAVVTSTEEEGCDPPVEEQDEPEALGQIQGLIYNDLDNSGNRDDGEPALQDWNVYLLTHNSPYTIVDIDSTDSDGLFVFHDLPFGTYYVCQDLQTSWLQTERGPITDSIGGALPVGTVFETESDVHDLIQQYCYEVILTPDNPESEASIFGNFFDEEEKEGQTLGASTTRDPNGQSGEVLAVTTGQVLATTGQPAYLALLVGVALLLGSVLTLAIARKK